MDVFNSLPRSLLGVGGIVLLALSLLIAKAISNHITHARRAKRLGCEPAKFVPSRDPLGILDALDFSKALQEMKTPDVLLEEFQKMADKEGFYPGTVTVRMPVYEDMIFTADPRNVQAILATQFKEYDLGPNRIGALSSLLGHGIFASDGKLWEHSRALLRPQFTRAQISDLDMEERHLQTLMQVLDNHTGPDGWTDTVDLQPLFFRLTLDSATEFLLGESVHSQNKSLPGAPQHPGSDIDFAEIFDSALMRVAIAAQLSSWYWIALKGKFPKMAKRVHQYIDQFVYKALDQRNSEKKPSAEQGGKYVFLRALAEETSDPIELRSQILNILLAGRDTTASLLGWVFFILGQEKNKHYFETLRAAILQDFGTHDNPKELSFTSLKNCQYLHWVVNETLRLYPVVPINVRTANQDTTLPRGGGSKATSPVYVKKGQDVGYSVYLMHRRRDIWGEDADEFKPERWQGRRPGWEYLPFNGGPRICIGQQFALTNVSYSLVRLLQRIEAIDGSDLGPVKHGLSLTNCPGKGVNVRLQFGKK